MTTIADSHGPPVMEAPAAVHGVWQDRPQSWSGVGPIRPHEPDRRALFAGGELVKGIPF
jgi:hypothetical protein